MKLYFNPKSRAVIAKWMLDECAANYEIVPIDFEKREHKAPEFLKINPAGKLPALVDGESKIFESAAICLYLADKFPEAKLAPKIGAPERGRYLSVNDSYENDWADPVKQLMRSYRGIGGTRKPLSVRYVGSLVADFHRNLLGGGVFCYPANRRSPNGKLRLLYEANPLAFVVEQAGGLACNGQQRILDVNPTELHQRTPLFIGSRDEVETATSMLADRPLSAAV